MRRCIVIAMLFAGGACAAEFEVATMTVSGARVALQGYTVPMLVDEAYTVKYFQMSLSDEVKRNPGIETYFQTGSAPAAPSRHWSISWEIG